MRNIFFTVIASAFLAACSSASFFVANLPVKFSDTKTYRNVQYGNLPYEKLDIYAPDSAKSAPVLVFFYGGRWSFGKKEQYAFAALPFVQKGYIVVIPDYAKYPDVKFPEFVKDGAKAVSWVYDHIGQYGGNAKNLYISGHSSGAHIGALVAVDPSYLKAQGKDRSIIKSFAGLAGPYDFIPEDADLKDMFGPPENYPQMQVPTFVDGKQPPMMLLHGQEDKTVILRNLRRLEQKIEDKGGIVETKIYPGIDHKDIIGALSWVYDQKAPVRDDMARFFEKHRERP
jgi:acetyl esterase/lipase